jgi:hypothetical protein
MRSRLFAGRWKNRQAELLIVKGTCFFQSKFRYQWYQQIMPYKLPEIRLFTRSSTFTLVFLEIHATLWYVYHSFTVYCLTIIQYWLIYQYRSKDRWQKR